MAEINILTNGDLQGPFSHFRKDEALEVPRGWGPWWINRPELANGQSIPDWQLQPPKFESVEFEGGEVAGVSTPYGTHIGGLFQQIPAVAGEKYELQVEGFAMSSEAAEAGIIQDGSDPNLQIGVDPTGGIDGESPIIEWSSTVQPVGWWETMRMNVTAQASFITVFLKSSPTLPKRQQSMLWRRAWLRPVGRYRRATNLVGLGDTHLLVEPERPQPGDRPTIIASSLRKVIGAELIVFDPQMNPIEVTQLEEKERDGRKFYHYAFDMPEEGLYDVRFVGDGAARIFAQRLLRINREVQIVPSGRPRTDYTRVYVLLPPSADEKWAAAAARGSFVGRYTVGFSADDAGVGDVEDRQVIAVNPHHWPETLTSAWYDQNYPGTKFIPVVADSPENLEHWLRDWMYE